MDMHGDAEVGDVAVLAQGQVVRRTRQHEML